MAESTSTKIGHGLAKALGIKLNYRDPTNSEGITRGESAYSIHSADSYVESEPTVGEWIKETAPDKKQVISYFYNLFPFTHWIGRYNGTWLTGDLVAGKF